MLTAAEQDYVEVIYRLETRVGIGKVRVTDIAAELGTKLPTVTRTVQKLTRDGLLLHQPRKGVVLSERGRRIAREILHLHEDLVKFFTTFLGLADSTAERDACRIEHGVSPETAQRLHEFMEFFENMTDKQKETLTAFQSHASGGNSEFKHLQAANTEGWRS